MAIEYKPTSRADKKKFSRTQYRTKNPETADYWKDRAFLAEQQADKTQTELLRDMKEVYRKSLAELDKEIQAFYGRYAVENGLDMAEVHKRLDPKQLKSAIEEIHRYYEFADPKKIGRNMSRKYRDELRRLSARAYMSRLEEIKARLKHIIIKLAATERAAYEDALKKVYADSHAQAAYTIDKGLGFSEGYSAPGDDVLTKVVAEKWLDSNYSDRIWADKGKLLTAIENELLSGIAQGHNPRKITGAMADRYSLDYRNCERLARTEAIHAMNAATYDSYKEHGVEKYQFVCGLDERTYPTCGALDGSVHEMKYKEEGINYPVMHPNCRCTTVPYFDDEISKLFDDSETTRLAYDEERNHYDVPASMSYEQWLRMQDDIRQRKIIGKPTYEAFRAGVSLKDIAKSGNSLKNLREIVDLKEVFSKIDIRNPGVNKLSDHSLKRIKERGVSIDDLRLALKNPLHTSDIRDNGTYQIIGEFATCCVSATTGRVTTAWKTGRSKVRKYKKEDK